MQQTTHNSYRTLTLDSNVPNQPHSSNTITINNDPSFQTESMEYVLLPNLDRLQSENKERVLNSLKQKIKKQLSSIQQQICIEQICLQECRTKTTPQSHKNHLTLKLSQLIKQCQMLKCNYHFTLAQPQKVINLLDSLDDIYHQIIRFQLQIMRLFNRIKMDALRHITEVKSSFQTQHYQLIKNRLINNFDYSSTKYTLAQIDKFTSIQYPNLQYPSFKINNMKNRIAKANVNNKVIAVQAINGWIERLYALEKKDSRIIFNRSLASFMKKSPSEQNKFSLYLKSEEYRVQDGKKLKRMKFSHDTIPFAAIEKELLPYTVIKLKVTNLGEYGGVFLGVSPMEIIQKSKLDNLLGYQGSYYLTNRGQIISNKGFNNITSSLPLNAKDEVWISRQKNKIIWKRRKQDKSEQQVVITLNIKEFSEKYYVCVHLEDRESTVEIVQ